MQIRPTLIVLKRRNELAQEELCSQIDELKDKLKSLIDMGASFNDIYEVSLKLDILIVTFYRNTLQKSV